MNIGTFLPCSLVFCCIFFLSNLVSDEVYYLPLIIKNLTQLIQGLGNELQR